MLVDCDGFEWITQWVLGLGRHAWIIGPEDARIAMRRRINRLRTELGVPDPSRSYTVADACADYLAWYREHRKAFAATNDVPLLHLAKPDRSRWDDRKVDHVRPYVDAAEAAGRFGVVLGDHLPPIPAPEMPQVRLRPRG